MSSTTIEAGEDTLLVRNFRAELGADFSAREIEGLVVPFDTPSRVSDPPDFLPYLESISHGAFRAVIDAPFRVLLDFEHYGAMNDALGSMGSIAGTLGHARQLEERAGGLYGTFKVLRGSDGDKALELASEGVLGGFSVAMKPLRSLRKANGVMERLKVHLDRVSLCRHGAYEEARVLAVRTAPEHVVDESEMPRPLDPVLAAELSRFVPVAGMQEVLLRSFTDQPWDESPSRWDSAEAYCAACAIDANPPGRPKVKELGYLPFREPGSGDVNVNALRNALAGLAADQPVDVPPALRAAARTRLERLLEQADSREGVSAAS